MRRVSEVLSQAFAILERDLEGSRFLDLFAGSGAGGIEALSRGAAHATFVEHDAGAVKTIRANLERAGLSRDQCASFLDMSVEELGRTATAARRAATARSASGGRAIEGAR